MKIISAVFDGLKYSDSTQQYAIELAGKSDAILAGVFLDDFTYHSYKALDLVGTKGISKVKIKHLIEKDKNSRLKSAESFRTACNRAGERCLIHHDKSIARQEVIKESVYSDLIVISKEETFTRNFEGPPTQFISDFLVDIQCPVMIVTPEYKKIEKVVLLYDGKPASVYAIKMFSYMLPCMKEIETEIISVMDPNNCMELPESACIKEFVEFHYPNTTYSILVGKPDHQVVSFLNSLSQNVLVVLGAYNRGFLSRWFKTSMADVLMKHTSSPLFIAHT